MWPRRGEAVLPWERAFGIIQGPPVCGQVHVCATESVAVLRQPTSFQPCPILLCVLSIGSPSALSPASFMCFCLPLSAPIVPSLQPPCADPFHPVLCVCSHPHLAPPDVPLCHLINHQHHAHCSQRNSTLLWHHHLYSGPMSQSMSHRTTGT